MAKERSPFESDGPSEAAVARHLALVPEVVEGLAGGPEVDEVSLSWRRSADDFHVNAEGSEAPRVLTAAEVRSVREPLESVVRSAQAELDRLYAIVREQRYVVLLCDANGIAIEHRGSDHRSSEFRYWGTWLGGVWSETVEGTNGIGTCVTEQRAVTVHQAQHFRARHISLSCSGAPIFDPEGRLIAVLDVSSIDPQLSAQSHGMTLPLVVASARAIEEQLFRERFQRDWIVAAALENEHRPALLLAVDKDHRVVGADRSARIELGIDTERLNAGLSLWMLFERSASLLHRSEQGTDKLVALTKAGGAQTLCALVTAPVSSLRTRVNTLHTAFLVRPRVPLLADLRRHFAAQPPRGGLSPGALRRVCEYVESHLDQTIGLETLAAEARLSVYHFARAFRESLGVSPHQYLLQQRIKKAEQLLVTTDLPLSSVAAAVGFSDQSHFARHFNRLVGTTPSGFRKAHR